MSLNFAVIAISLLCIGGITDFSEANPDAARLLETLFTGYNRLIRPVEHFTKVLTVKLKLRLSQLLDVVRLETIKHMLKSLLQHEKNQIVTSNVWLKQEWIDCNFRWDPEDYGGVTELYVPADLLWTPDIVLYNNADGNYEVSIITKAVISYNGTVVWEPPAVFKSMCQIDIKWFPFDEQHCELKFGSWSFDGDEVDLVHYDAINALRTTVSDRNVTLVNDGIDLSDFTPSVEWDIMAIPSERHEITFDCCPAAYIDITFYLSLRRKTLFYTVNLIIPCVGLSFLTILVFYLPSESGEKVQLSISILISLTLFLLLLVEIIPSTSLVVPLIGFYLLFVMIVVTLSISLTVITLNVRNRSPHTHQLPNWARTIFTKLLPWLLGMTRPSDYVYSKEEGGGRGTAPKAVIIPVESRMQHVFTLSGDDVSDVPDMSDTSRLSSPPEEVDPFVKSITGLVEDAVDEAVYIADFHRQLTVDNELREDWRYIAQVLDRFFLIVFSLTCVLGTGFIILRAPVIYDTRPPLEYGRSKTYYEVDN